MTVLDPSQSPDLVVLRAVARFLLTEQNGAPPSRVAIDTSTNVLAAMIRTGQVTMVVQVGIDIESGLPGRWLHMRVPDGGMDAYIALDELRLPPELESRPGVVASVSRHPVAPFRGVPTSRRS